MKFREITISLLMVGSMVFLGGCAVYESPPYHSAYYYADPVYPYQTFDPYPYHPFRTKP